MIERPAIDYAKSDLKTFLRIFKEMKLNHNGDFEKFNLAVETAFERAIVIKHKRISVKLLWYDGELKDLKRNIDSIRRKLSHLTNGEQF